MDFEFDSATKQPPQKSTFLNVLAWIFIVLGGFATFMGLLQNIMIHMMFPKEQMSQLTQQAEHTEQIPFFAELMFNHFDFFFLFFLLVSAASFIAAIALLKRKNWARITFIVLMAIGIAWNLFGLVLQFTMFSAIPEFPAGQAPPPEFQNMMQVMKVATVIMVIAFSSLFAFIIMKLSSKKIKAEFA